MPKLIPDPKESSLYIHPITGKYYVRKSVNGTQRVVSLKTKDRQAAINLKHMVLGRLPGEKTRVKFEVPASEYIEICTMMAEKTFISVESTLRLHLWPHFAGRFLDEVEGEWSAYVTKQRILNSKRKLTHDHKYLKAILIHAKRKQYIDTVPSLPLAPQDRYVPSGRSASAEEIWSVWRAASPKWQLIIEIAAVMGLRRGSIRTMQWEFIDWENRVLVLPTSKNGKPIMLPIEAKVFQKLKKLHSTSSSPYVFPHATNPNLPMTESDRTWTRILRRAGVKFKFHWLRHASVSMALRKGHSLELITKTKGMSTEVGRRIYAHAELEDARNMASDVRKFLDSRKVRKNAKN
jgi:integrase